MGDSQGHQERAQPQPLPARAESKQSFGPLGRLGVTRNNSSPFVDWSIRLAGALTAGIGSYWLAAWLTGYAAGWSAAGAIILKTNMALAQLLGGASLLLLAPERLSLTRKAAGAAAAFLILLIGSLTLGEHLFDLDLGIDQLLAREPAGAVATASPNRMGPPGSSTLAVLGAGLLALVWGRRKIAPYLGLTACLIQLVPAVGFLYGITEFYGKTHLVGIAWPTVVALLSLGIGLVLAQPQSGPMALLLRRDPGGMLLRRLFPVVVLVPLALGLLRVIGEYQNLYDTGAGTGILVVTLIVVFSVLLWRNAARLSRSTAAQMEAEAKLRDSNERRKVAEAVADVRQRAEAALQEANERLEQRVAERTAALGAGLAALTRMHALSGKLLGAGGLEPLLQEVMDAAVAIAGAERGTLQLLEGDSLRIVAHHGHQPPFLDYFANAENRASVCGAALQRGERVVVPDVEASALFAGTPSLPVLRQAGVRAVQSTPMVSRAGALLGILTTQWDRPHLPDEHALWRIDLLSRQAADLIEQARAEEALRVSEERFRSVVENMSEGLMLFDAEGLIYQNPASLRIHGFNDPEEEWGKHQDLPTTWKGWDETGRPLSFEEWPLARVLRGERFQNQVLRALQVETGHEFWANYNGSPIRDTGGKLTLGFITIQEITQRKRAEEQLSRSQKLFSELVEDAPFGIYVVDSQFRVAHMNAGSQTGAFRNVRPVIGRGFAEVMRILWPEPVAAEIIGNFRHTLETGEPYYSPCFIHPRHDVEIVESYEWELHRITLADGQFGVICYYFDSTKLRQAEAAAQREKERLLTLVNSIPDEVWFADAERNLSLVNPSVINEFGKTFLEGNVESIAGSAEVYRADGSSRPVEEAPPLRALAGERVRGEEEIVRIPNRGELRHRQVNASPVRDPAGKIIGSVSVVRDITDQKRAEEALRKSEAQLKLSLRDKEVMLREIHHRVKNNLQVIASLVDLQTDTLADPAFKAVFQDVRDRVRSMALVHEKLYQSESLARVDFAEYAESLLSYLVRSHRSAECAIALKTELQPVTFSVEVAVPCGLILNELVSNAIKHAFRGRAEGAITTALGTRSDGRVFLRVSDNGVGLPAGMDWRQSLSMGLRLIQLLARQLNATVEVQANGGTAFELAFAPEKSEERK